MVLFPSYEIILGMDWLHLENSKVNIPEKVVNNIDEKVVLHSFRKKNFSHPLSALQFIILAKRKYQLFIVRVHSDEQKEVLNPFQLYPFIR